jgi:hypothetical protein
MGLEDVLNGAKTGVTFYGALFRAVAQTYGMEPALALNSKVLETIGTMQRARM